MQIEPAIAALRGDPALQRKAQAAMFEAFQEWRAAPAIAPVIAELERYGRGEALAGCGALHALLRAGDAARGAMETLVAALCPALRREPFGHPPMRHAHDPRQSTLVLARSGPAQLVLQSREVGDYASASVTFSDAERHELVLAGEAEALLTHRLDGESDGAAALRVSVLPMRADSRFALSLHDTALQVTAVARRLVVLRLHRFASAPRPSREYRREDGALLHQSAGDLGTSRKEAMLALLGRFGRRDAAPVMAEMALENGDPSLRWQALRECLALDSAAGFTALGTLARAPDDPLSEAAGALRAQLLEAHPQLRKLEEIACPA